MPLQFDNKISLGHVLTFLAMLIGGISAWSNLRSDQDRMMTEMTRMQSENSARESRLRTLEIAQASQSSDLRSIQTGISEIKATLDKLSRQ